MFATDILKSEVTYGSHKDTDLMQEYRIYDKVKKSVKSIGDFKEALSDLKSFKKEIRQAVLEG